MKRRLFWKILIGFWITLLVITQGIWLMFALLRPLPEQSGYVKAVARESVTAAAVTVHLGGEDALLRQLSALPSAQRSHIAIQPLQQADDPRDALARANATAPDGRQYSISYYSSPAAHAHGFFNIPPEVLIVSIIGGLAFSTILAWYLTKPIERMRQGFGRLAAGNFATRLGPSMGRRQDEIADLAHDFDRMAVRLEELVAARDRLLADVSHELRTPLARLNLAIGLAKQDPAKLATSMDRIGAEAIKLDQMVGELLTLAKLESGQPGEEDYFNFAEVVAAVTRDAQFEASTKDVRVDLHLDPGDGTFEWIALGSGKLMSRAIENIIRNALRYSPEAGRVLIDLRLGGGSYRLTVSDDGPGIPTNALGSVFKPFAISADGFGFGLGLAIAQRAIAVHGGAIAAHNRTPHGLDMVVTIPAVASSAT